MSDFEWWRKTLNGEEPLVHEYPPECGFYKIRDRRGLNRNKTPIKRPFIAAAIWRSNDGELQAELAGQLVEPEILWPYCAKHPIPHEEYAYWHKYNKWPEKAA